MDFRQEGNVVRVIPGANDRAIWATEDDYRSYNDDASADTSSNSNYNGSSEPPNKKSKNFQGADSSNRPSSKAIGKMFFKTKLCCRFRAGTCPYVTNCNFAHSVEELRRPPPNWQELVASHDEEPPASSEPREEFQIPSVGSSGFDVETPRSHKGRHCKKFYTDEGCPYGDNCTFLHDEQSKARESVIINLGPGAGGGYGSSGNGSTLKPSNWKTRICNKWELTGYCPFGNKCHFAHGIQELHKYGGGLVDLEAKDAVPDPKQTPSVNTSAASASHSDVYHPGAPPQKSSGVFQRVLAKTVQKWKGPDKISKIYGDWIDDL